MLAATSYPLLDAFWTVLEIFFFVLWIWLVISIYGDIFRSHDLTGFSKAMWVLGILIFPYIGVLGYLIVRGGKMHERAAHAAIAQRDAMQNFFGAVRGTNSTAQDLAQLADLRDRGVLSPEEFEREKARVLAQSK